MSAEDLADQGRPPEERGATGPHECSKDLPGGPKGNGSMPGKRDRLNLCSITTSSESRSRRSWSVLKAAGHGSPPGPEV